MRKFISSLTLFLLILFSSTVAWAKEPATPEFTLQKAVQEAITHSAALKTGEINVDRSYEVRKYSAQNLDYVPIGPTDIAVMRPFYALKTADLNWQMNKKNLEIQRDAVELAAHKAYNAILLAQEQIKVSEKNFRSAERQGSAAAVSFRVGMINQQAMVQAEANLTTAKANDETAKKALDDAYQKFNQLVGLWPEDRPVLSEEPAFEKIKVDNLDGYIESTLESNPSLWEARENVNLTETMLGIFNPNDATEPSKAKELDVDKAKVTASDAKDQARKAVRTVYYTVTQLEDKYAIVTEQVKVAEENLRVTKIKFDVGMATATDVAVAEGALEQAKQQVLDTICQHDVLKLTFYKPWASAS